MRNCDIVMKGGITSGVVYPAAVFEIAKKYVFKNIGGTSAGAIAASLTAAAERQRCLNGSSAGFDKIAKIPTYLATDKHLYRLFVPNKGAKSLFRTVVGLFGRSTIKPEFLGKWCGLVWAFPLAALIGAVPGLVSVVAVYRTFGFTPTALWTFTLGVALASIIVGMTVAIAIALVRDVLTTLPNNFYGLVTGIDDDDRDSENALCTWLSAELSRTAGLAPGVPLTFGMLWEATKSPDDSFMGSMPPSPDVNLEMITTNVTWGRPFNFPIESHRFYFDPKEMRRLFPDYVVNWMVKRARTPSPEDLMKIEMEKCLPLPEMGDFPVVVATRMSLAFPFLLSAVPLWSVDFSKPEASLGKHLLERVWFSDGGISSNFPVTLFDSPLPRWPTFAINLSGERNGHVIDKKDQSKNISMIQRSSDGALPVFSRFSNATGFVAAIVSAMQNWTDNTQMTLPGYRDRIVTVYLGDDEGGLNLDMPPPVLELLRQRGAAAGALIAKRFEDPSDLDPAAETLGWESHRWLRFRNAMGLVRGYVNRFQRSMSSPESPDVTYDALCRSNVGIPTHYYPIAASDRANVADLAGDVANLGTKLQAETAIAAHLPKPLPDLVVRASLKA